MGSQTFVNVKVLHPCVASSELSICTKIATFLDSCKIRESWKTVRKSQSTMSLSEPDIILVAHFCLIEGHVSASPEKPEEEAGK